MLHLIMEAFASRIQAMRDRPRRRRDIPQPIAHILGATLFRYSPGRHAYVLRLVGGRWGPVLRDHH
jgi:hypothetical protein